MLAKVDPSAWIVTGFGRVAARDTASSASSRPASTRKDAPRQMEPPVGEGIGRRAATSDRGPPIRRDRVATNSPAPAAKSRTVVDCAPDEGAFHPEAVRLRPRSRPEDGEGSGPRIGHGDRAVPEGQTAAPAEEKRRLLADLDVDDQVQPLDDQLLAFQQEDRGLLPDGLELLVRWRGSGGTPTGAGSCSSPENRQSSS